MTGLSFRFMIVAVFSVLVGMLWGIQMSASGNHMLSPGHAHLNLIGWVSFALFAVYYHVVPQAAEHRLAKIHFLVSVAGLVLLVPGIVLAIQEKTDLLAKIGSVLGVLAFVLFLVVVFQTRRRA